MAVPAAMPLTTPVVTSTVATSVLLLLQVPPVTALVSVVVVALQMLEDPDIVPVNGNGLTVMVVNAVHPPGVVYVMFVVPDTTPFTTPFDMPMVATPVLLLCHVPPVAASVSVVVALAHTAVAPEIGSMVFTVMVDVAVHPAGVV